MIKIPPAILSDGLAKHELNQLINMENLLAHIVNRHGQNFLSVTTGHFFASAKFALRTGFQSGQPTAR